MNTHKDKGEKKITVKLSLCPHGFAYCTCQPKFRTEFRKLFEINASLEKMNL